MVARKKARTEKVLIAENALMKDEGLFISKKPWQGVKDLRHLRVLEDERLALNAEKRGRGLMFQVDIAENASLSQIAKKRLKSDWRRDFSLGDLGLGRCFVTNVKKQKKTQINLIVWSAQKKKTKNGGLKLDGQRKPKLVCVLAEPKGQSTLKTIVELALTKWRQSQKSKNLKLGLEALPDHALKVVF